ncbi:hypothetical protein AB0J27_23635 [Micromonospora chokoriensis]
MTQRVRTDALRRLLPAGTPACDTAETCAYRPLRGMPGWRD